MKKKKLKKRLLICLCLLLAVVGTGVLATNYYVDSLLNRLDKGETYTTDQLNVFDIAAIAKKKQKITNIALLAIDGDEEMTTRTDVMKVVSMNETKHTIAITSLQRDFIVYHPMVDMYEKLNHAFYYNGIEGTLNSINYNFDLDVMKYVLFDYESVEYIVDMLGGIDVYVTANEIKLEGASFGVWGDEGSYNLDGWQILRYCRMRHLDSDYNRMDRQTKVIKSIIQRVKNMSVNEILDFVNDVLPYIKTNLTNDDIKGYILDMWNYDLNNIAQYQFPNDINNVKGSIDYHGYSGSTILKDWSQEVIQLHKNIYDEVDYEPSQNVIKTTKDTLEIFKSY